MTPDDRRRRIRRGSGSAGNPGAPNPRPPARPQPVPEFFVEPDHEAAPTLEVDRWTATGHRTSFPAVNGNGNGHRGRSLLAADGRRLTFPQMTMPSLRDADMTAILSATGKVQFVSASVESVLGFDGSLAVGEDAFELFDPGDVHHMREIYADLVARRRLNVTLETRVLRADGSPAELELSAENHLDDAISGILITIRDVTERNQLITRVREVDRRQSALVEALTDALLVIDAEGAVVRVNEAFERLFHVDRNAMIGQFFDELLRDEEDAGLDLFDVVGTPVDATDHPVLVSLLHNRKVVEAEIGYRHQGEALRWVRVNVQPVRDADGEVNGAVATLSDVTDIRRAEYALRQEREFLRVLLDTLDEGIVACDSQGRLTVFNPSARKLHGLPNELEPIGRLPSNRLVRHPDGTPMEADENPLLLAMSGERLRNYEILLTTPDGGERVVRVNGQPLEDESGWKLGAVVAMHDVTEEHHFQERLWYLAYHDGLTGLANRVMLYELMQDAIAALDVRSDMHRDDRNQARGVPQWPALAVFLLDLDRFKAINDTHGHSAGDALLRAVAERLRAVVRPEDTVARLSGDEFVVMCRIERGEEEMEAIRRRIVDSLTPPYRIDGMVLEIGASVGATMTDDPRADYSHLLGLADDDMFKIKEQRGSGRSAAHLPARRLSEESGDDFW